jgi:uncharacterized protein YbjT (DUF2867 family)
MSKTILITGATGKQGGGVINALLTQDADVEILAVTRNTSSGGAQKLQQKDPSKIKLVEGNLDDTERIFENAKKVTSQPVWGVFSVQSPNPGSSHQTAEENQGKALVDAALENSVQLFVYTSVDRGGDEVSFDNPTPIPHFISKHNIEHYLVEQARGTNMSWTVLRPVAFMDNFTPNFFGKVFTTAWKVAVKDKPLQLVSVEDIGFFGAQAFINPEIYKGKCLSLAGDELTFEEMGRVFKEKTGNDLPLTFEFVARLLLWLMPDFGEMFRWFYDRGYGADIRALRNLHPGMRNFGTWLEIESGFEMK